MPGMMRYQEAKGDKQCFGLLSLQRFGRPLVCLSMTSSLLALATVQFRRVWIRPAFGRTLACLA